MTVSKRSLSDSEEEISPKIYKQNSPLSFTCSLPPTCSKTPSIHSTEESFQDHNSTYHSFFCHGPSILSNSKEGEECSRVFPTKWLLELHENENHNPVLATLQSRGEKIFKCLQETCTKKFLNPKFRRLHLIEKHDYPSTYFFSVVNWGVSDLLKKGGGMIRKDWIERNSTVTESEEDRVPSPSMKLNLEERGSDEMGNKEKKDEMDELILAFGKSEISMVPRAVRRAANRAHQMSN